MELKDAKVSILQGRARMLHSSSDDIVADVVWRCRCHAKRANQDRAWLALHCACGNDSVLKPSPSVVLSIQHPVRNRVFVTLQQRDVRPEERKRDFVFSL